MIVQVITDNTSTTVRSPYDDDFRARAKTLNGRFAQGAWVFDARDDERVRQLCLDIYGTDGSDADEPPVTVRLPVANGRRTGELRAAGLTLVRRRERDRAVQYGDDVVLVSGGFPTSGGSMKYPDLNPHEGTVIEVRDLPRGMAEKMLAEIEGASVVGGDEQRRAALLAERAQCEARIAEIDETLGALA